MHASVPSRVPSRSLPSALVALASIALAACADVAAPLAPGEAALARGSSGDTPALVQQELAAVRNATARFHDFDTAVRAGYSLPLSPCVEVPGLGGMGFHYGNPELIDGDVSLLEPEVLLYEPQKNGRMRLVAIEYIVPLRLAEEAPSLLGHEFHRNDHVGVWALHVWLWQHNPAGMFEDFNPTVSCEFAP